MGSIFSYAGLTQPLFYELLICHIRLAGEKVGLVGVEAWCGKKRSNILTIYCYVYFRTSGIGRITIILHGAAGYTLMLFTVAIHSLRFFKNIIIPGCYEISSLIAVALVRAMREN